MLRDRVKCAVANPGGPIGVGSVVMLGAAPVGFRSFLAAFGAAQPAYFVLSDGAGRALGGIWTVNGDGTATITAILINDATGGAGSETFASACTAWCAMPSAHALTSAGGADATARNQYATLGQVQNSAALWGGGAGGTANALTISLTPAITAYAAGQSFRFIADATNTGAVTLSVNGLSAASVAKGDGLTALAAGDIPAGHLVTVQYDGVRFRLGGVQSALGATLAAAATPAAARTAIGATVTGSALMTAADAPAARTAIGATATGAAVLTATAAAAAQAAIGSPAIPTGTSGVPGQFILINPGVGGGVTLPAGGTWIAFGVRYGDGTGWGYGIYDGNIITQVIAAGGTTVGAASANRFWLGFAWRVS